VRLPDPSLFVLTDRSQAHAPLDEVIAAALAAGCRWVSVREKDLPAVEQIALAKSLLAIARSFGACVTVHGDPDDARACGADGIHLSAKSDAKRARAVLGADKLVGLSIHGPGEGRAVDPAFVDYVIGGPVHETISKPGYGPALGVTGLRVLVGASAVPVIGIGGIEPETVAGVIAAGAKGIAVMGAVMRATDPGAKVAALLRALSEARVQLRAR
jgi:thiamine-phosphate pyrophosphorylase